ncbi:NUDIX hydrolase [Candidatus Cerribacteria bacterium 'Amazon FNV 2010 28 9']|uniref:NUDIX hydrolase n=1 Tax=Candidatus Cerribacteria bacterium 'Amazon FNV 2010 28 9' TaxID=2081795 RepID=A0A317JNV5_9BACT|nr:MAG: NUDIX hydrolase [Candidatus Cerribacteria bacterium 'Amazon FNV 2010 28 9']
MTLSDQKVKRCLVVAGWTVHKGKTLLVKHKKLGMWLAPGGHIEENELPHEAAEREFFEETGVIVRAVDALPHIEMKQSRSLPSPFYSNLHTINKHRGDSFCEQHVVFCYFVKVIDISSFSRQEEETDDLRWFTREEAMGILTPDLQQEAAFVFDYFPSQE